MDGGRSKTTNDIFTARHHRLSSHRKVSDRPRRTTRDENWDCDKIFQRQALIRLNTPETCLATKTKPIEGNTMKPYLIAAVALLVFAPMSTDAKVLKTSCQNDAEARERNTQSTWRDATPSIMPDLWTVPDEAREPKTSPAAIPARRLRLHSGRHLRLTQRICCCLAARVLLRRCHAPVGITGQWKSGSELS